MAPKLPASLGTAWTAIARMSGGRCPTFRPRRGPLDRLERGDRGFRHDLSSAGKGPAVSPPASSRLTSRVGPVARRAPARTVPGAPARPGAPGEVEEAPG